MTHATQTVPTAPPNGHFHTHTSSVTFCSRACFHILFKSWSVFSSIREDALHDTYRGSALTAAAVCLSLSCLSLSDYCYGDFAFVGRPGLFCASRAVMSTALVKTASGWSEQQQKWESGWGAGGGGGVEAVVCGWAQGTRGPVTDPHSHVRKPLQKLAKLGTFFFFVF